MRHRNSNNGFTETTDDMKRQCNSRLAINQKGEMPFRNKFHLPLRFFVLVVSGLFSLLYIRDFLLQDHARATSVIPPMTPSKQYSPSTPVIDSPTATTSSSFESSQTEHDSTIKECGIWMAPSSLRPNPGFGIFTTRNIAHHESILHQPDAVSIALHDMRRRDNIPLEEERRNLWMNVFGNVSDTKMDVTGDINK
jgi:hypothetical protein